MALRTSWKMLAMTAVAVAPAPAALAVPLSVSADFGSAYVAQGATLQRSVDINAAAGAGGLGFASPYAITGGSMTFFFTDDSDGVRTNTVTTTEGTMYLPNGCYGCLPTPTTVLIDDYRSSYVDPGERASVTVGGSTASGDNYGSTYSYVDTTSVKPLMTTGSWGIPTQVTRYHCRWVWGTQLCGTLLVYYTSYSSTSVANAPFSITMSLDGAAITDLASDGVLEFSVFGAAGDVFFRSALLNIDIDPTTAPPGGPGDGGAVGPGATEVPEPGTLSLMMLGVAMLATLTRRRHAHSLDGRTRAGAPGACGGSARMLAA